MENSLLDVESNGERVWQIQVIIWKTHMADDMGAVCMKGE